MVSPWLTLLLAVPVLLAGEWLVRHVSVLKKFNIPAPVVGGLIVSFLVLAGNLTGLWPAEFGSKVTARWWTWLVTIEPEWLAAPAKPVNQPFLVAFFTCIGLNASWTLVKKAGGQVLIFLGIASVLAVLQNCIGVGLAIVLGQEPLLGLVCGSVTMTGGHGTALGFAADLEKAGLNGAATLGVAAATFGLVAGGLIGGPIGGGLIQRRGLRSTAPALTHLPGGSTGEAGILGDLRALYLGGGTVWRHLLILLVCIKAGAWMSYFIQLTGMTFPVYIGAMLIGLALRNIADLFGTRWVRSEPIELLASISLGVFLTSAMIGLNLMELAKVALPMLVILSVQTGVMGLYAWFVTFRLMGTDFDAAVLAGGHCGFGMGATPSAIANMKALVERFGPAPRAFLIVPLVGGFLIDLANASNITVFLNLLRH
jgi:ESS family glutamate:Na+ symporter